MIWGAMSSSGVGVLCFIKSKVNAAVCQDVLEGFMLPSADKLYGDSDFIFQQELARYVPIPGLMTIGLLFFIGQQTRLI